MSNRETLARQTEAFNRKDADALGALLTDDYSWYRVGPAGPELASQGRAETVERMRGFFAAMPYASSRVEGVMAVGNLIVAIEKDSFIHDGRSVEKTTLGVYEYREGKLARAWAFPAE
jgi:hypothetical protein